jgi:2,3-bisphosphoglycerate-independent phosphoglycerate mutase
VVLAILDGFGESAHQEYNAVASAHTPALDALKARFPHGLINASELHVGLPQGQMGNSEVGHMNIGSGRVLMQELPRVDHAITDGSLARNPALVAFIAALKKSGGSCHLLGLLSPGGVHSHQRHMAYLARTVAEAGVPVYIHAFLDGRDTPPQSALEYLDTFVKDYPQARFATVSGRYYAMDRDKRWDRVERAYEAIADAQGSVYANAHEVVKASYAASKHDEFVLPAIIEDYKGMQDGDGVLMANFRADRAREILHALLDPAFTGFARKRTIAFVAALGAVEYSSELNRFMTALFSPEPLKNILGEVIAARGLRQLHIAETEKYAHVTFFFNGGREEPFPGEERILVPSPNVATYDLQPEMSAPEVTDKLVAAIDSGAFDFIVVNYANCDMVGHTGDLAAATQAVEAVDSGIGRVWQAVERQGGAMIITADHGNAEQMHDEDTHQPHTAHTLNLVPAILCVPALEGKKIDIAQGKLADLAPTVLKLMGITQPAEMTGKTLF